MFSSTVFDSPVLCSLTRPLCLAAVLALGGVEVYAQAGDPPAGAPAEVVAADPPADISAPAGEPMLGSEVSLSAAAVISTAISFQGRLEEDESGADGMFDFRFRLFDDPAVGTQAGEVFANSVAVENGLFNVLLDFGSDAFAGEALWLEIGVRPTGGGAYETIVPREPLTAAPLALSLPNVTTNPTTGYVSIGDGAQLSSFHHFGINKEYNGWVGMYVTGGGPSARPYYGYATDDEGSFDYAWTEYNGSADEWRLYVQEDNVFSVSDNGDVGQPAAASGLVKAAAYVECWNDASFLTLYSSFNNVNSAPVTVATGPTQGECYVDFGFSLSNRFYSATAVQAGAARGVTCDVDGGDTDRLRCMRWRVNAGATEGWGGRIMVSIY